MTDLLIVVDLLILLLALLLVFGLIRPWWVLWFMAMQNRKMVLKYYGSLICVLLLIKFIIPVLSDS